MSTGESGVFGGVIHALVKLFTDNGASEDQAKGAADPFAVLLESLSGIPIDTIMGDIGKGLATGPPTVTKESFFQPYVPPSGAIGGPAPPITTLPAGVPVYTLKPPTTTTTTTTATMTQTPSTVKTTVPKYMTEASAPVLATEGLLADVSMQQLLHTVQTVVVGLVSITGELLSLGQIDQVLTSVHSMLALFDWGETFAGVRAIRLENSVFRPMQYYINSQNPNMIPNPADLVRFRMREDENGKPILTQEEFERLMGYLGYGKFFTDAYWTTRFNNPSNMELLELWRRGEITKADVRKWMLLNEQHPAFVDMYLKVLERLPTRIEARLMSRRRPLKDTEIEEILRAEGIKDSYMDDYRYMFRNWDIDSIYGRIQSQTITAFADGFLSENEFRTMLGTTNASPDETDAMLYEATLRRLRRQADERKDTVLLLYKKRIIKRDEANAILVSVGYEAVDIEHWLDYTEASRGEAPIIEKFERTEGENEEYTGTVIFDPLDKDRLLGAGE